MSADAIVDRIGSLLLIVAFAALILPAIVRSKAVLAVALVAVAALSFVPVVDLSVLDRVYTLLGGASGASLVLLAAVIARPFLRGRLADFRLGFVAMAAVIAALGIPFYVIAFGFLPVDPYRFGYGGWELPLVAALILAFGYAMRSTAIAAWIAVSSALYIFGVYASRNFIDYLVDPLAVFLSILIVATALFRRSRRA